MRSSRSCVTRRRAARRCSYNRAFTQRILGLSEIESRQLLDLLFDHCEQASFQVRWSWSEGDIAFWDNRCTMHYAARDYGLHDRLKYRVTLKGTRPLAASRSRHGCGTFRPQLEANRPGFGDGF